MSATCSNFKVDGTTLTWVDGALTTVIDDPAVVTRTIESKYAVCGGFKFDATVFKLVDKVLTLKTATASPVPVSLCGSSFVDGNVFSLDENNTMSLKKTEEEDPEVETVTITYKDGADGAVFDDVVKKVAKGETTPAYGEADPVRENYTFKGWNPTVAGKATADATYTATWEKTTE